MRLARALVALGALALFTSCSDDGVAYPWNLPAGFPSPRVPDDNPMSVARAELGRYLFYDTRLSGNQTYACATCHQQSRAFTDGLARAVGSTGMMHRRNSMSLTNVAYNAAMTWVSPVTRTLEQQAVLPMFGEMPIELGLTGHEDEVLQRFASDSHYPERFVNAFPGDPAPISIGNIVKAIATFERTLISANAPYDRALRGDATAMSASAQRGRDMFFSERLECYHCHGGFNFTDAVVTTASVFDELTFHNTGLYNVDGHGAYPASDPGLIQFTGLPQDMGRFRAPTLRNIELTAPYMHDGSVATLEDVLAHYGAGGRTIADGPNAGVGHTNPHKDSFVLGFQLSAAEQQDVLAFLRSLTDWDFVHDSRFASPFGNGTNPSLGGGGP